MMTSKKNKAKNRKKYFDARARFYGEQATKEYFEKGGAKVSRKEEKK